MVTVTPFLWFDADAEAAIEHYRTAFPDLRVVEELRMPDGALQTATIELAGQRVTLLNGGPGHPHTDAFSLLVTCEGQAEVDRLWDALLSGGGSPGPCGWLTDPFGVSWQVVPSRFLELTADPDPERVQRVIQAMLTMSKFDVAQLEAAAAG